MIQKLLSIVIFIFFVLALSVSSVNAALYSSFGFGTRGPQVTELQQLLTKLGFYNGPVTGYFGNLTRRAVIKFQQTYGISPATGFVGPLTRGKLNQVVSIKPTSSSPLTSPSLPPQQSAVPPSPNEVVVNFCSNNTNDINKLDVVFVPVKFEDQNEFASLVLEHIDWNAEYKGLLYFEPFKSSRQKFKFWRTINLPANIENSFVQKSCRYADSGSVFECATEIKNWLESIGCSYDKALIIVNNSPSEAGGGWAESLGGKIAVTIAREYPPFENQGHMETVHEFAHLLGLADEVVRAAPYITYNYTIQTIPNCDLAGCSKWCRDYVKTPSGSQYELCKNLSESSCRANVNCVWVDAPDPYYKTQCVPLDDHVNIGLACLENTGCYHNCNGVGAWRPADYAEPGHRPTSMMFYMVTALGFDAVDQRYLKTVLEAYR
jgi:hypothetical protein